MTFDLQVVGDGQAKRPFAPSLDRIDRHKAYEKVNLRLVTSIANFAMNAWGDRPLLQLAHAIHMKHGNTPLPVKCGPSDSDLDASGMLDADQVETALGPLAFPPRTDLHRPILELLRYGPKASRQLEDALADRFKITKETRDAIQRSGIPAWHNHISWALVDLGKHTRGTGEIECIQRLRAPDGGTMGIYRLRDPLSVASQHRRA